MVRRILSAEWFTRVFPTRICEGQNRATDFRTTAGGAVVGTHLGKGITGSGGDWVVIDDPHDITQADLPAALQAAIDLFEKVVLNRRDMPKNSRMICVGHRVHRKDLSAYLIRELEFSQLKLPLIAVLDQEYDGLRGVWRRRAGELLRPDAFTKRDVDELRRTENFEAIYQQEPPGEAWNISPDDFLCSTRFQPTQGRSCSAA